VKAVGIARVDVELQLFNEVFRRRHPAIRHVPMLLGDAGGAVADAARRVERRHVRAAAGNRVEPDGSFGRFAVPNVFVAMFGSAPYFTSMRIASTSSA
jgi:hypothetical protein